LTGAKFFYGDPSAPAPNRPIGVGVLALIEASGALLMERRSDCGRWGLPGGAVEVSESLEDTLRREMLEETGLVVRDQALFCVSADPTRIAFYPDGNVVRIITFAFIVEVEGFGGLRPSEESLELGFVEPDEMRRLDVIETARPIVDRYLSGKPLLGSLLERARPPVAPPEA
jgi:8-oxo-dGTP pyrophosphatase MutT (NUDIX family)